MHFTITTRGSKLAATTAHGTEPLNVRDAFVVSAEL